MVGVATSVNEEPFGQAGAQPGCFKKLLIGARLSRDPNRQTVGCFSFGFIAGCVSSCFSFIVLRSSTSVWLLFGFSLAVVVGLTLGNNYLSLSVA